MIPAAYSFESSGDSLLLEAYIQATAVLEINPPKIKIKLPIQLDNLVKGGLPHKVVRDQVHLRGTQEMV